MDGVDGDKVGGRDDLCHWVAEIQVVAGCFFNCLYFPFSTGMGWGLKFITFTFCIDQVCVGFERLVE
jgi:hypothetical protein